MGAQLSNLTFIMELALETNLAVAANFLKGQHRELRQVARDRQYVKQIELQPKMPD